MDRPVFKVCAMQLFFVILEIVDNLYSFSEWAGRVHGESWLGVRWKLAQTIELILSEFHDGVPPVSSSTSALRRVPHLDGCRESFAQFFNSMERRISFEKIVSNDI
jgi:hypothetical protein